MTRTKRTHKHKGRPAKTKAAPAIGYAAAAAKLGVKPSHLWRVLNGERTSHRLMARYNKIIGRRAA